MNTPQRIAVLGAGSWGTAVAIALSQRGHHCLLWGRDADQVQRMQQERRNQSYLPDIIFPQTLEASRDLQSCVEQADYVLIAVPSKAFVSLLHHMPKPKNGIAWLTKGINPSNHQLLSQSIAQHWGDAFPMAVISGPSFAREVALSMPTALVLASRDLPLQSALLECLHSPSMRVDCSDDVEGVQLCGSVKNVLAIACGISDGIGYGANAKAALITRGLAEMRRLLEAYPANPDTCLSLAGVGDLVLTCTDNQSRNRRFGLALGQGLDPAEAEKQIGQVVEGQENAKHLIALAQEHQVDMPICQAVQDILVQKLKPEQAVALLMNRPPREE